MNATSRKQPSREAPTGPTPAVTAAKLKKPARPPSPDEQRMDTDYDPDPSVTPAPKRPSANDAEK